LGCAYWWAGVPPLRRGLAAGACFGGAEVCKYREHTSVAVFALRDVELQQDVAHVRLDSSFAHVKALGDGGVAEAFGDECEHVPFAVGQLDERTFCADWCDEAPDDLWVEPGSALGDRSAAERNSSTARTRSLSR
jgi:hypothetical protein